MRRQRLVLLFVAFALFTPAARSGAHPGSGIAVDEKGRVFFTDTREGAWRVDDGGRLTLVHPEGLHWMAVDRAGKFSRGPEKFGAFTRLTPAGERPTLIACAEHPFTIGTDGNLYYPLRHSLKIMRRTPAGEESVLVDKEKFNMTGDIGVPGIACGPDGTLYLVALDSFNRVDGKGEHVIWSVKADGTVRQFARGFVREKDKLPPAEQHPEVRPEYCRGIAVAANGDVYVAVTGNRCVMRLTPSGESSIVHRTAKPWIPTGVDVFKGEVYVLEYDDETPAKHGDWPPRVTKVGRDGKVTAIATIARKLETAK